MEIIEPELQPHKVDQPVLVKEASTMTLEEDFQEEEKNTLTSIELSKKCEEKPETELSLDSPKNIQADELKAKEGSDRPEKVQLTENVPISSEISSVPENILQVEGPVVNSTRDQTLEDFPEIASLYENRTYSSAFETARDMKYLRAWLRVLNPEELETLLEQEYNEDEELGLALENYLSLILFKNKCNDDEWEDEQKEEEEIPVISTKKSLPISRRKSHNEDLN